MWCLISQNSSRIIYIVTQKKDLTVGRIADPECDHFAAIDDPSISRKHAILSIVQGSLYLQDMGSRYGTFVNETGEKLGTSSKLQLKHNNVIKFGKLNSVFMVQELKHITCTSTMKGENLQNLKIVLEKIGGIMKSEWEESCTYLTMPAITLTIKVVLALVQGSHIVTPQFWYDTLMAINNNNPLPDPKDHIPQVIETTINKDNVSFVPDERRSKLFSGMKFVFFSKRLLEMYKMILEKSSATPLLLSQSKMTKSMLCSPNVVVIQFNIAGTSQESQAQRNQINEIVNYLNSKGKRVVADAEIGLAVLYCSTSKYCNPNFSFTSEVFKNPPSSNTIAKILAQETQDTTQNVSIKKENIVINESLTPKHSSLQTSISASNNDSIPGAKRKLDEEMIDNLENKSKKIATEHPIPQTATNNDYAKRKLNDEAETNPSKRMAVEKSPPNDDDFFNLIDTTNDTDQSTKASKKKLNLFKPVKKTPGHVADNDDDLFNFVQDTANTACTKQTSIKKMFESSKSKAKGMQHENKENYTVPNLSSSRAHSEEREDNDLQSIMSALDLGSTIVKVKSNLIVKKELINVEERCEENNFKKFKKVWPVKMQFAIIPKSSMKIVKPDGFDASEITSLCMSDNE